MNEADLTVEKRWKTVQELTEKQFPDFLKELNSFNARTKKGVICIFLSLVNLYL